MNILKYLFSLIIKNPWKVIFLTISIVSVCLAGTFPDYKDTDDVVAESVVKIGNSEKYLYIYQQSSDSYGVYDFDEKQEFKDGKLITYDYHPVNIVMWVLFGLFGFLALIFPIEEDGAWDFKDTWIETFYFNKVKCIYQEKVYYYTLRDRLLTIRDRQIDDYELRSHIEKFMKNKYKYPEFYSVEDVRESKLKNIGIK